VSTDDFPLPGQVGQQVEHVLGAPHGEGGNDDRFQQPFDQLIAGIDFSKLAGFKARFTTPRNC